MAGKLLRRRGNRIDALFFGERPSAAVPPLSGRAHLFRLLERARAEARPDRAGATDLAAALARAEALIQRRALVIVVSDFLAPEGWEPRLRRLTARLEVVAVRLLDPREVELPDVGLLCVEDPETGAQLLVDTADRRLRERFRAAAAAQRTRLEGVFAACGVDLLTLGTDEDLLPALIRFFHRRRLRGAAAPGRSAVAAAAPTFPAGVDAR